MAFCTSVHYAAELLGTRAPLVSMACTEHRGTIHAKKHYVRFGRLDDIEDAKKGLVEFDRIHGINARYYPTGKINSKSLGAKI